MSRRRRRLGVLPPANPVPPTQAQTTTTRRNAALTICDQALNRYDAVMLLTMCGLLFDEEDQP